MGEAPPGSWGGSNIHTRKHTTHGRGTGLKSWPSLNWNMSLVMACHGQLYHSLFLQKSFVKLVHWMMITPFSFFSLLKTSPNHTITLNQPEAIPNFAKTLRSSSRSSASETSPFLYLVSFGRASAHSGDMSRCQRRSLERGSLCEAR